MDMTENNIYNPGKYEKQKFEDLKVFKKARELIKDIYGITNNGVFSVDYALKEQIRRAGISIISNIAEGFERGSSKDFIKFLYISKGSCGEVRAQLIVAFDQGYITDDIYNSLSEQCLGINSMIHNLIKYRKEYQKKEI